MEKLTIEQINPYLAYGLKGMFIDKYDIVTGIDYDFKIISSLNNGAVEFKDFKPALRNISDLTKEIEVNGKKFVPMKVLFSLSVEEEEAFDIYGTMPSVFENAINVGLKHWEFWQIKLMHKWLFAIDIPEHLYIDINTLKSQ